MLDKYTAMIGSQRAVIAKLINQGKFSNEAMDRLPNSFIPVLSKSGKIIDYRISLPHEYKEQFMSPNMSGIETLSKMFASKSTRLDSHTHNVMLINFLRDYMKSNMDPTTHLDKNNLVPFVEFTEGMDNKYFQNVKHRLPGVFRKEFSENLLEAAYKGELKKTDEPLYIREDWLHELFGVESATITDIKTIDKTLTPTVKKGLHFAEYILRYATSEVKRQIVQLLPQVVVDNVLSNYVFTILRHGHPIKHLKMLVRNAALTRQYLHDQKKHDDAALLVRLGKATDKDKNDMIFYQHRMEQSPVHKLVEAGMLSIVYEDLKAEDQETTSAVKKWWNNLELVKKTAKFERTKESYIPHR